MTGQANPAVRTIPAMHTIRTLPATAATAHP
jgi:hypothetical protein